MLSALKQMAAVIVAAASAMSSTAGELPFVGQRVEPGEIRLGETARLTLAVRDGNLPLYLPPSVAGLEFAAVGDVRRVVTVKGARIATRSIIYRVTPRQAGEFTIPALLPRVQSTVLRVTESSGAMAMPGPAEPAPSEGYTAVTPDGAAFIRVRVAKQDLYVGESVPIDIQVGTRAELTALLNGMPTLRGDAFALKELSARPQSSDTVLAGTPYSALTWHSILAAIKPGEFSLTVEAPLIVRTPTASPATAMAGDENPDETADGPAQTLAGYTEKAVTPTTREINFSVLALPTIDRPAGFSGAVGKFTIGSELSKSTVIAGDPLTLSLRVTGAGSFDRVDSRMLQGLEKWKTYPPSTNFGVGDERGYQGRKTFEQSLIPIEPGTLSLPPLAFSYFDPDTRRYEVARTGSMTVRVLAPPAALRPGAPPAAGNRIRDDHADNGSAVPLLTPPYFHGQYWVLPSTFIVSFSGAWLCVRRRRRDGASSLRQSMETACAAGNAAAFFRIARFCVQRKYGAEWRLAATAVTPALIRTRLTAASPLAVVLELADELDYSPRVARAIDIEHWQRILVQELGN